jgi:hypothetical protein
LLKGHGGFDQLELKPRPRFGRSQSNADAALGCVGSYAKAHNTDRRQ